MEFFDNQRKLFGAAFLFFTILSIFVAILPALQNEKINRPLPGTAKMSDDAIKGKAVYIANGCVACHTQQVRNVDMDKMWGNRPGIAADYAGIERTDFWRNTATLMGTERTGPDLTNIGLRQAGREWNLIHLFNPRIVVQESIMPSYPWLFTIKEKAEEGDVRVNIPEEFLPEKNAVVVAKPEALQLVSYLQSLKQTDLPDGRAVPEFLYPLQKDAMKSEMSATTDNRGATLYAANCQSCHQPDGNGLPGAFPALKGSRIVLDNNPETMIDIILNGYNARAAEGYAPMPPVGTMNNLTAADISAIINHERTSWGNNAPKVTPEEVEQIISSLSTQNKSTVNK